MKHELREEFVGQILAEFDGLRLRAVAEEDRPQLEAWIAADPWHRGQMEPEFFMGLKTNGDGWAADPRATCFALEDGRGVLFYIRLSRAARVNIQFAPDAEGRNRRRDAVGLLKGMAFLEAALARAGAEEWIFSSGENDLRDMAEKRLGFVSSPDELVRIIARPEAGE